MADKSPDQATALVATVAELRAGARTYFADVGRTLGDEANTYHQFDRDYFWDKLPAKLKKTANDLTARLLKLSAPATDAIVRSPILSEADRRDLGHSLKAMRAALRLRKYQHSDPHVIHDEDRALGIQPASQREDFPLPVDEACTVFDDAAEALTDAIQLTGGGSALSSGGSVVGSAAPAVLRPGTAFIMMSMDPQFTDVNETVKRCSRRFEYTAQRADDIEHQDVITARIIEEIRTAEVLFADLTGERPSVYYEVGYAHAIKRPVILYRKKDTPIHFDLAAYNCPPYTNLKHLARRAVHLGGDAPLSAQATRARRRRVAARGAAVAARAMAVPGRPAH